MNRRVNTIRMGETQLEYSITGEGTPILLFHGGHSNCYEEFGYKSLVSSGYSIITPSRAGYGQTSSVHDLEQACFIYNTLLDHLQVKKVHVIAVSAGGPTGIRYSAMFPERVTSLTLQCAVAKLWHSPKDKEYKMGRLIFKPNIEKMTWSMLAKFNRLFPRAAFKMMLPSFSQLSLTKALERMNEQSAAELSQMYDRQRSHSGFLIDLEQTQDDYAGELTRITAPALIMHSRNDNAVPVSHAEHAAKHIPHSELYILDSWGHLIWIGKHADDYEAKLLSFLSGNPTG